MSRTKDSIKHQLRVRALDGITDNDTLKAYRRACDAFAEWCKGQNIKDLQNVTQTTIQHYADYLTQRPEEYTPATIHAKLAPVCKAAAVNMKEIKKPKRTAARIQRGRKDTKTGRGEREAKMSKYERLVTLQRCAGIRRAELAKLEGRDLIRDGKQLYVMVRGGKGGKDQKQWILPEDREAVTRIFKGVGAHDRVFSAGEMENHINLHKLRAEHAKRCYDYYMRTIDRSETAQDKLRAVLLRRWENGHTELLKRDSGHYRASRQRFIDDMDSRPYELRGENRTKARALGLPVTYNRLALMAVSVLHLSHWRLDVTVTNYLIQ